MEMSNDIRFFLGANSPSGFISNFNQLERGSAGWRMYVIKGGPGSGKSTLMKKVAAAMEDEGHRLERIPCPSDPDSLDAIIDYDAQLAMADGTAPHVIEAKYPGAYETIVNTASAWDENILQKRRKEIMEVSGIISRHHGRCTAYLAGAGALLEGNRRLAAANLNRLAITDLARTLAEPWPQRQRQAVEETRLLSAISVGHVHFHQGTIMRLAHTIYTIEDPYGAAAHVLLEELRFRAIDRGLTFYACPCSMVNPGKWEHLILPEIGVAFTTANRFHRGEWSGDQVKTIDARELMRPSGLAGDLGPMEEALDQAAVLVDQAALSVKRAKDLHDVLEAEYVAAIDFDMLNRMGEALLAQML